MKNFKRVDGDYTIQMVNTDDVLTLDSTTVEITGNLEVTGNVTYVNTEQMNVNDPFLALNNNEAANYSSNAGILVHKTSTTYAGLRYNDDTSRWEISTGTDDTGETGSWQSIAGGAEGTVAGSDTEIQFNDGGAFGADSDFRWFKSSNLLYLNGGITLRKQSFPQSSVGNSQVLFADEISSGGTGTYVTTENGDVEELVSKTKAIVFGIIF